MKRMTILLAAVLFVCSVACGQESQRQRLEKHLYTLASDSLRGREAGTFDGQRAMEYIIRQWQQMGLKPLFGNSYLMPFEQTGIQDGSNKFCNLVAVIEGSDPALRNEYILIGAHYDHVGVKGDKIYNGADDNASGSSCLLEVARQLLAKKDQLKRSVIICAFDAEEKGLFGSRDMVKVLNNKNMLDKIKLMMSVDMVGWYQANGELILEGSGTLKDAASLLQPKNLGIDIKVHLKTFENSLFTATDTEPFAEAGIPTLAVTTGLKSPYHKPEDDADLIDYEGLDRITDYISALTINVSCHNGKLASGRLAAKHHTKAFDFGISLGYNSSKLIYPEATFEGLPYIGMQGGLVFQYNFNKYLALRTNVLYNYTHCHLPAADDAFGKGYGMEQHSVLVPLTLQIGINEMGTGISLGLGMFYGYIFDGGFYGNVPANNPAYSVNANQAGFVWKIGIRLGGHWLLDGIYYFQLNDLFDTSYGLPRAKKNIYSFSLGYCF